MAKNQKGKLTELKVSTYRTLGGWKALVIWLAANDPNKGGYAIHRPGEKGESPPIYHAADGTAHAAYQQSACAPPRYGLALPADLVEILEEKRGTKTKDQEGK